MDPNSAHQLWSIWSWTIEPSSRRAPDYATIRLNCARFGRKAFGSIAEMRVEQHASAWEISVLAEGHPVHEPRYVDWMQAQWRRFFEQGFGLMATIRAEARLVAGDCQDGRPPDQLIILPTLATTARVGEES